MPGAAPKVKCPVCLATGSVSSGVLSFGKHPCGLCEGRAYLYCEPYKCAACKGHGKRRERGHFLQSQCRVCHGLGFTKRQVHPCKRCNTQQSSLWESMARTACTACGGARWVEGVQTACIVCKGVGNVGVPSTVALGTAAAVGGVAGSVLGVPGAALGAAGCMYWATRGVRVCHGCNGAGLRLGMQLECPRCKSAGVCDTAGATGLCPLCAGCGVVSFPTTACPRCTGGGVSLHIYCACQHIIILLLLLLLLLLFYFLFFIMIFI
jgi:DnaJ-class molecular chaperone